MATYTYRAFDQEGLRVYGARNAADEKTVEAYMKEKDYTGYEIFLSKTKYSMKNYKLVSPSELALFCRQMSIMFFSSMTIMEGLLLLVDQTGNKQLKYALLEIHEHMDKGYTLSETMAMYEHIFGQYLVEMIIIGETSGSLDSVFSRMSDYFEKEHTTRKKVRAAITYPAVLTVLMAAIIMLLILKILPMFQNLLYQLGGDMPAITKVIFSVSSFINKYLIVIIAVIVGLVVLYKLISRTEKGKIWADKLKISVPISRYVFSRIITARFARSLSILIKSGVQLLNAMEDTKNLINNKHVEEKFEQSIADVKAGKDLSEALESLDVFPPIFLRMLVIGQATGHIDEMLDRSAGMFDQEVDDALERLTAMLEPILIIILSIVVGIILISVMLPMIDIMNAIG